MWCYIKLALPIVLCIRNMMWIYSWSNCKGFWVVLLHYWNTNSDDNMNEDLPALSNVPIYFAGFMAWYVFFSRTNLLFTFLWLIYQLKPNLLQLFMRRWMEIIHFFFLAFEKLRDFVSFGKKGIFLRSINVHRNRLIFK